MEREHLRRLMWSLLWFQNKPAGPEKAGRAKTVWKVCLQGKDVIGTGERSPIIRCDLRRWHHTVHIDQQHGAHCKRCSNAGCTIWGKSFSTEGQTVPMAKICIDMLQQTEIKGQTGLSSATLAKSWYLLDLWFGNMGTDPSVIVFLFLCVLMFKYFSFSL